MDELELLKRKLAREKAARKEAERILEEKAIELFRANQELIIARDSQEVELKKRISEIEDKERTYRNLIENASDLIYTCDVEGRLTYANPMLISFSGFSEERLIGSFFNEFVSPDYKEKVEAFYANQFNEKLQSTYTEFPVVNADGKEIWIGQTVDMSISEGIIFNVLARDVSDRKQVERALMRSEEKYKSIIENMELGLLEVDRDGKIIRAYPKFSELTGYSNEELMGKDAASYFLSDEEAERMRIRNLNRLEGQAEVYEVKLRRKNGTEVWVLISGAPYYDEKGLVEGSIGIHLDISLQKDLEVDLRNANRIAEESLKAKDLFLANISHEIRTPLNAIIGISELILNSHPTEIQKKYLETIMTSGDNLLCLINEILDLSKIQSGKFILRKEPVNLSKLIEHIHRSFSVIGKKKGLTVDLISDLELNQYYLSDSTRLKEVLFNLVGNAVKFTQIGSVTINVKRLTCNGTSDRISFEIVDTGVGIPEEDLEYVFQMFSQASNTNVVSETGTGLGLAISNGIIENMGGKLMVTSELGKGSRFRFDAEFIRTDVKNEPIESSSSLKDGKLAGYRILVVEDAEVNRFLVNSILTSWGCVVQETVNGLEAIKTLKTNQYDLVLMDVRMPIMDGLEATRIIRNELKLYDLPIIALTANAIEGEINKCKEAKMDDYLSKPYSQNDLHAMLLKHLSNKMENPTSQRTMLNLDGIDSITRGDKVFQKRMVHLFIEETKLNIDSIIEFLKTNDEKGIQTIAHTMKAAIAHICTNEVLSLVKSIEMDEMPFDDRKKNVNALIELLQLAMKELIIAFPN